MKRCQVTVSGNKGGGLGRADTIDLGPDRHRSRALDSRPSAPGIVPDRASLMHRTESRWWVEISAKQSIDDIEKSSPERR